MLTALEVFTVVVVGLMVGVEFAVASSSIRSSTHCPGTPASSAGPTGVGCWAPSCRSGTSDR